MNEGVADFRGLLSRWLIVTSGTEVAIGLSRDDALVRAERLYRAICECDVPQIGLVDDESKDVLYALVAMLEQNAGLPDPQDALRIADSVYRVIHSADWPDDVFAEKRKLLERCASAGWGVIGYTLETIAAIRKAPRSVYAFSPWLTAVASSGGAVATLGGDTTLGGDNAMDTGSAAGRPSLTEIVPLLARVVSNPGAVAESARSIYRHLSAAPVRLGVFDEHDYVIGIVAFVAATARRFSRDHEEAGEWLDRADASFTRTLSPELLAGKVATERLCLELDLHGYDHVIATAPAISRRCDQLGLKRDALKAQLAGIVALKDTQRYHEALQGLESFSREPELRSQTEMRAVALLMHGELLSALGHYQDADALFDTARQEVERYELIAYSAHLRGLMAESYRDRGQIETAIIHYRAAAEIYAKAGMDSWASYVKVLLADTLLIQSRYREAELEILAAMPAIEEKKLVQEGVAALTLLRKSLRRRQTDRNGLRQFREHLRRRI